MARYANIPKSKGDDTRMLNLRTIIVMLACLTACQTYGYETENWASDYVRWSQRQVDINLQHSMMQSQVNALYNQQPIYVQAPARQTDVDTQDYNRPTYVIDKPLYKFGE